MEKQATAGLGPLLTLVTWFESNRRTVIVGAAIAVILAAAVGTYFLQQNQKVVAAGEALTDLLVSGTFSRGAAPVTPDKLLKLASEHAGTTAAGRAVFQAATVLFVEGKYAEAQTQFQRFISEQSESEFVPQARYAVAACLEAQGKADEAAKSYQQLADRFKATGLGLTATFSLARILDSQGKLAEAMPLFEEVARSDPNGMIGGESRVRLAEIQQKLPPPPALPVPPATPPVQINPTPLLSGTNGP